MKKVVLAAALILFGAFAGQAYADEDSFAGVNPDLDRAVGYKYCFSVSADTTLFLRYNGKFIYGVAENPSCGVGYVAGDVIGTKFVIYRDWTSANCTEGVWYTGNLKGYSYEWYRPEDGASGTGTMQKVACP